MAEDAGRSLALSPLLAQIEPVLLTQDRPVYLVGGAVRDALLGREHHDLDFAVAAGAISLAFTVADTLGLPAYVLDRERDIGRVVLPEAQTTLDFAAFRGPSLGADLRDRDFTINAMALPAGAHQVADIIDPCGGRGDLQKGLIRLTHPQALLNDPVRTVRALRMALRYGGVLTAETEAAVRTAAPGLTLISPERVRDEWLKLMMTSQPGRAVGMMAELAILPVILPEIAALEEVEQSAPHHEPVLAHTMAVLRWLADVEAAVVFPKSGRVEEQESLRAAQAALGRFAAGLQAHLDRPVDGGLTGWVLLRLGGLFHDAGKAQTQSVEPGEVGPRIRFLGHEGVGARLAGKRLRALHLSNEAVATVQRIVKGHMRPLLLDQLTRRAVYRYFRATGSAGLDIGLIALADHLATYDGPGPVASWEALLDRVLGLFTHYFEHYQETVAPPPLVSGSEIIAHLNLRPGPEVGRLLKMITEAQAAGEIDTRAAALDLAVKLHQQAKDEPAAANL